VTLRARLALALGLLTAAAVTTMAVVGYRATASRLYNEIDASLTGSATRFADPDANYARAVCQQLRITNASAQGGVTIADLPGTSVQCLDGQGRPFATSAAHNLPVGAGDAAMARKGGNGYVLQTEGRDRILTVSITGGGAVQLARDLNEVQSVLNTLRTRFAVIGAIVTALAAVVGWLVARRVSRPVVTLTAATEEIAQSGRLDIDVPPAGNDETGRLARSFATMLDALRRSREQQQRLAEDAGHELRTPLTSLRTNVEVLQRHPDMPEPMRERILTDINSELRELTELTNELVALSTSDSSDEATEPVDLAQLAARAAARTERRRHHRVVVDAERAVVVGKPRQLMRVMDNLLHNAAKFDSSADPIEVTVRPGFVQVRDHGAGLAPDDMAHVFDRFYRAPTARSLPGSGLGLSIAHDIVAAHGGTLLAGNAADGGAVFTMTLPVAPPEPLAPPGAHDATTAGSHPGLT
jgi:two-component system sensor histidine kinase MprB